MAIPPWTIELLRRGLSDVARKASEPATYEKIRTQASEILQDLPQSAARSIDAVIRTAEAGKKSVERWTRKHTALAVPILNASGVLQSEAGTGVPVAETALEVGREFLVGDTVAASLVAERLERRLNQLLPAGSGHSIAITSSLPAALSAFSLLANDRQLIVHRAHAVRLSDGTPLPDAFGAMLPMVREVGSVNGVLPSDFDGLEDFCVIMADGGQSPVELLDLSGRSAQQAVVLPVATVGASGHEDIPSAEALLSAGADFVIMPGNGVCGGPDCGIIIGPEKEVQRIRSSLAWNSLRANDALQAMMLVTLELAASDPNLIPVRALMDTGEDNLRARAERLGTRLTGSDRIQSCQITDQPAKLTQTGRWQWPSRQVRLRHASMSAEEWMRQMLDELPAVIAAIDGEEVCVDLRWIAAADDAKLAEALGGRVDD